MRQFQIYVDSGLLLARNLIRLQLERACARPIRRHLKIKGDANPFDPAWRDYFEERVLLKRFGGELVEKYGFLLLKGKQRAKPVMETGSA